MSEMVMLLFNQYLNLLQDGVTSPVGNILALLMRTTEGEGPHEWTGHRFVRPGIGIAYKRGRRVFCRFEPKVKVEHSALSLFVRASVLGATEPELQRAGTVHQLKDGRLWVAVRDEQGANALAPLIRRAFKNAGAGRKRP
jgi:hypothetical protein